MSKDTPEVGDVWINSYCNKLYIVEVKNSLVSCITDYWGGMVSPHLIGDFNDYTYLGKSKANINDLFKTENEE